MMKHICSSDIKKLSLFIAVLLLTACEKVVVIDVKDAGKQVVVQGDITNEQGPYVVRLNYSTAYYNSNEFPPVTGAQVVIDGEDGNSETLTETTQGLYKTNVLQGVPGKKYTLRIAANGTLYTATSSMPLSVAADSVWFELSKIKDDTVYRVICNFKEKAGVGDYYRIYAHTINVSGNSKTVFRLISDKVIDGEPVRAALLMPLKPADTVMLELQCINKSIYDFYNTISTVQVSNIDYLQFFASLPANPTNNISNKGLGYFSAHSVVTTTLVAR